MEIKGRCSKIERENADVLFEWLRNGGFIVFYHAREDEIGIVSECIKVAAVHK